MCATESIHYNLHTKKSLVSFSYLEEISGGDKDFQKEIIMTFLEEINPDLALLKQHADAGNWIEMGKLAHKVKAPVGMLCGEEMKERVLFLEKNAKAMSSLEQLPTKVAEFLTLMQQVIAELKAAFPS